MTIKKICIITPAHWTFGMGGIEYQVKLLLENLLHHKNIEITYLSRKINPDYKPEKYKIHGISSRSFLSRYGFFSDTICLLSRLKSIKPDIIYQNGGCAYTGIAAHYAKKNNIPMIWHVASDNDLPKNIFTNFKPNKIIDDLFLWWGTKNASIVIAQTEKQKIKMKSRSKHASIHLIRNFHPVPSDKSNENKANQIVWVANLKQLKQPEIFINLARSLSDKKIDVRCFMIGGPAAYPIGYQERIEKMILETSNLAYLGRMQQDQVNRIISQSKILVNTSKWEGFPNTFIQAWMRNTPVVSLNCDPDCIISKNNIGIVSGSAEKLANDIIFLLKNDLKRRQMGINARNYALKHHSLKNLSELNRILTEGLQI